MADDLTADHTPGFKVGEKKTMDEIHNMDNDDEAMIKYKKSLGLTTGKDISDKNDPRKCIIKSLTLIIKGRPAVVIDTAKPGAVDTLKNNPFSLKEGCTYEIEIQFQVQHEILSGLKYIQQVKRKGISLGKDQEMIGSYAPNTENMPTYRKTLAKEQAPSGMLARGTYSATSRFVDDDNQEHLKFEWAFEISKDFK